MGTVGWTGAQIVTGGYRRDTAMTLLPDQSAILQLPASKSVPFEPYLTSMMVKTSGRAQLEYGPVFDTGGEWQRLYRFLRWPKVPEAYPSCFRLSISASQGASVLWDDVAVDRITKAQYAQWSDWAVSQQGPKMRACNDSYRYSLMPVTRRIIENGGTLRVLIIGDSISDGLATSGYDALIERSFPHVKVESTGFAIGGSGSERWLQESYTGTWPALGTWNPQLFAFLTYSDSFNETTATYWNQLIPRMRALFPAESTDILIGTRLDHGDGQSNSFVAPIAAAHGVAFYDADLMRSQWMEEGGHIEYTLNDDIHPSTRGREVIGQSFATWMGAMIP